MFDTMKVAKKIREARIAKNMTQMQLADAMGVSYQAVSNWERGNSMPDISKLEDLCGTLEITVSELLGMEEKGTAAVEKVLQDEALTVEELAEIVPVLPPETVKEQAQKANDGKQKWNIKALAEIAMFMDDDLLEEIIEEAQVDSLKDVEPLAPFLDDDLLDKLVRRAPKGDVDGITALAPFLDEDTLDYVIRQCDLEMDKKLVENLAPFLDEDTIDYLADVQIAKGNVGALRSIYPFMDSDTVRKVAKALMESGDLDGVKEAAVFM